jgi:SAM-dependent methyltransferase
VAGVAGAFDVSLPNDGRVDIEFATDTSTARRLLSPVRDFDELVADAERFDLEGWDFSALSDRWVESSPPWDYRDSVLEHLDAARTLLDMGTGGGEFLSTLPLPELTVATEGYPPNVPVAHARLAPLGVEVVPLDPRTDALPFRDGAFDLVINRHESFDPREVARVLAPAGTFLTQQVGGRDLVGLNELLDAPKPEYTDWSPDPAVEELEDAGLRVVRREEAFPETRFADVGAVVSYLRAIPWQVPDFDAQQYRTELRRLQERIEREGPFSVSSHRFLLEAAPDSRPGDRSPGTR